jgi:hypothetical protein
MKSTTRRNFVCNWATGLTSPLILGATNKSGSARPVIGEGAHRYEVHHDWGQLPASIRYGNTHGVVEDSKGRIFVHHTVHDTSESHDTMVVFDEKGKFIKSWGKEFKGGAHGLHIQKEGREEFLYLCDTRRAVVVKTTLDGAEVFTLGYPRESDKYPMKDGKPAVKYSPTNLAVAPGGDIYVADGYGSYYVNQYNSKGEFIRTFGGGKTKAAGDLNNPHGIWMDTRGAEPQLVVADRANNRLQYFNLEGHHVKFVEGDVMLPCHFDIFRKNGDMLIPDLAARVTLLDRNNKLICHLGDDHSSDWKATRKLARDKFTPGKFICPHGASFDHKGNIFVVEWVEVGRVTKLSKV